MNFNWDEKKNLYLKENRNICFEDIIVAINENRILDIINHPNQQKYPGQKILIVEINNYAYMVPYNEDKEREEIFLKTIIPSRKMTKIYLRKRDER